CQYVKTVGKTDQRIATRGRAPLMGNVALVTHVGNLLGDETVIEFLAFVDFGAGRHSSYVDVAAQVEIVFQRTHDIAIHDLHMVDVVQYFDARRANGAAHIEAPVDIVEDLVGTIVGSYFGIG